MNNEVHTIPWGRTRFWGRTMVVGVNMLIPGVDVHCPGTGEGWLRPGWLFTRPGIPTGRTLALEESSWSRCIQRHLLIHGRALAGKRHEMGRLRPKFMVLE